MTGRKKEAKQVLPEHMIRGHRVLALLLMVEQKSWDSLRNDLKVPAIGGIFKWLVKNGMVQEKGGNYYLQDEAADKLKRIDPGLRRMVLRFYCATVNWEKEKIQLIKKGVEIK